MSLRVVTLALAALSALQGVMAEADCLGDGASCPLDISCPKVCCSGVPPRTTSGIMHCPAQNVVLRNTLPNNFTGGWVPMASVPSPTPTLAIPATDNSTTPSPIEGDNNTPAANPVNADVPPQTTVDPATSVVTTPAPSPTGSTSSVDALQSTQSIGSSRGGGMGGSTILIAVGAFGGCAVIVAAVMYKRKATKTQTLEIPGSSYHGAGGAGLTPDNRSLDDMMDGMLDGGARATTDSMKQLPVLSMAGRGGSSVVRLSSPFGQNAARISSPAHRGGTNEDYAFDVEIGSRAGSSVEVAFVDAHASDPHADFDATKTGNGVVAL